LPVLRVERATDADFVAIFLSFNQELKLGSRHQLQIQSNTHSFENKTISIRMLKNLKILWESLLEGGWDTAATQSTVIRPSTVKKALDIAKTLIDGFNSFLDEKGIPHVRIGTPLGSSTYHEVDPEDKIYGDIDLQLVVPELPEHNKLTVSQVQGYWGGLLKEYTTQANLDFVHKDSESGHPILKIGEDQWVQVDMIIHQESLERWGRYRATPERGVKGLLMGNMFSTLGSLLDMSIQHAGAQYKLGTKDQTRKPYATTRKDYEMVTVTSDPENFVKNIFDHEYQQITGKDPRTARVDKALLQNPGVDVENIKVATLVKAVKGLAVSFAMNNMYGKGSLAKYNSLEQFLSEFMRVYEGKAEKDINSAKRDKATTPEAIARAESDREKVRSGLEMIKGLFSS